MFRLGTPEKRAYSARDIIFRKENELLFKTTRGGASTNIISRAAFYDKNTLYIGPTIATCNDMVQDAIELLGIDGVRYTFILTNKECFYFKERAAKTPNLNTCAKVYNIDSNQCAYREEGETTYCEHYNKCPVVELLRIDLTKIRIITVTHPKFASYYMAYQHWLETRDYRKNELPPIAVQIYLKLLEWADIVFYDECHYLELPDITSKLIYKNNEPNTYNNLKQYAFKNEDGQAAFPLIEAMVEHYIELLEHPLIIETRDKVIDTASSDDYWKSHLCNSIKNPNKFIFRDENGQPYEHQESGMKEFFDLMLLLIEHIGDKRSNRLYEDIATLYDIATIITANIIALSSSRTGENISVELLVNDDSKRKNTAHLLRNFRREGKKIIMTSATIGEHDYEQYLGRNHLKTFWGGNGDPLNTNANMMVLCDSKTYDVRNKRYGLHDNLKTVAYQMIRFMQAYGDNDVIIFAMSKMWAIELRKMLTAMGHPHEVDYYGSTSSVGVSNDARVSLHLLMGEKPTNMCDCMFEDNVMAKNMRLGLVHASTMQAKSRCKDPNGILPSIAVFFGVRESKVRPMLTWGSNRKVTIDVEEGVHVTCDQYIPMPHIKECKDYDEMLEEALKFKSPRKCEVAASSNENSVYKDPHFSDIGISAPQCGINRERDKSLTILPENNQEQSDFYSQNKYVVTVIEPIFPIIYSIGNIDYMTVTRYLYLNKIIGRHDIFDQLDDEGEFERQNRNLDPEISTVDINILINRLKVCMLTTDNKVGCMFFDIKGGAINNKGAIAKQNKNLICNFLDSLNISYYLEEEKFSFRIWLFFSEKIEARSARDFGKAVLKELSIEEGVEVYPKKCINNKNSKGDFVKLPSFNVKQISSVCTTVKQEG